MTIQGYEQKLERSSLRVNFPHTIVTTDGNLIIATAQAHTPYGITITTIQGSSTHTENLNIDTSLPTVDYYPALVGLPNGNILWHIGNHSVQPIHAGGFPLSRDGGITWTKANDEALSESIDISSSTEFTPRLFWQQQKIVHWKGSKKRKCNQ